MKAETRSHSHSRIVRTDITLALSVLLKLENATSPSAGSASAVSCGSPSDTQAATTKRSIASAADRIAAQISKEYKAKFGDEPTCSLIAPSDGAHIVA